MLRFNRYKIHRVAEMISASKEKKPEGFLIDIWEERFFYIDAQGMDAQNDVERWRLDLYYEHHLAKTVFFGSEFEYQTFLVDYRPFTYATYFDFSKEKDFKFNLG
jgi:hypothetical protein